MDQRPPLKLSVIVPVYNERDTIREILRRILEERTPKEIILVNDGSTDGTTDILSNLPPLPSVQIIHHPNNRGKGVALQTGLHAVTGDVWIVQDADLELDPSEYPKLLEPIASGNASAVFGSRFKYGNQRSSTAFYLANRILTELVNRLYGLRLTDVMTGYKMLKRSLLPPCLLSSKGFEVEIEIAARLARRGVPIIEVPISYNPRPYSQGKKIRFSHLFSVVRAIVKHRITR